MIFSDSNVIVYCFTEINNVAKKIVSTKIT